MYTKCTVFTQNARYVHKMHGIYTKNKNKKCTREIKLRIATAKSRFNNKEKSSMFSNWDWNLRKTIKCYIWSTVFVVLKIAQCEK
jgi:hypothetical protein